MHTKGRHHPGMHHMCKLTASHTIPFTRSRATSCSTQLHDPPKWEWNGGRGAHLDFKNQYVGTELTVAILAQGTLRAVALAQAFFGTPFGARLDHAPRERLLQTPNMKCAGTLKFVSICLQGHARRSMVAGVQWSQVHPLSHVEGLPLPSK